ncbi:hypothetical protein VIBR0546_15911 [Vibrio brasiliensis LMG 20546]|uniref:Uncharacterized protein n=1 Tax=Vibrio brasiliensis LMG 20546 TaxID=945543 RepID=E8LSJ3_9VIBR|nr:hypothetical protein VIBR0546_15911 [Vibrio brasiliensis LMG 20546]
MTLEKVTHILKPQLVLQKMRGTKGTKSQQGSAQ